MEEYKQDLGDDYVPLINMIDINSNEQLPRPRPWPEQQRQTTLPHEQGRTTADIMADILLRKQQQQRIQHRTSSSHLGGDEGGEDDASKRRVRSPSPTSTSAAATEQSLQASETSIVTTTRRKHRPRTSIIVTTLFSLFYFVLVFASKIDIILPSYLKSASESVHQLYCTSEAWSYLEYIEELARPAVRFLEYTMSRAASDISDVSGALGGRPQPPSPPTSVHPSPASPPAPLGPLESWPHQKARHHQGHLRVPHQEGCHLHRTSIPRHQGHLQQVRGAYIRYNRPQPSGHHPQIFQGMSATSEWHQDRARRYRLESGLHKRGAC